MSLAEIQKEALALNDSERAQLALSLLETLPPDLEISDDEVLQRDAELQAGRTEEISHEELIRQVEEHHRR